MTKLLCVDWDFFCPSREGDPTLTNGWALWDWGHREDNMAFYDVVWLVRAAAFARAKEPRPMSSGEEDTFWSRFRFKPTAKLYYAESNVQALHTLVKRGVDEVWLFDAHHDSGYGENSVLNIMKTGRIDCGQWMIDYGMRGARLHMRYPRWKPWGLRGEPKPQIKLDRKLDDGKPLANVTFDRVFVCRSGAWSPPWLDDKFHAFIAAAPVQKRVPVTPLVPRKWDEAALEKWVEAQKHFFENRDKVTNTLESATELEAVK